MNKSFLVIQTAFTGDVILATALLEKLHQSIPNVTIDILVRKGNEILFTNHPFIREILVWNKNHHKYRNLFRTISYVRKKKYDVAINLQRFASTGLITAFSGAKETRGFNKNPFSFLFTKKFKHDVTHGKHEIERNQTLIVEITNTDRTLPKLYPSSNDFDIVKKYKEKQYITISPMSVWKTKTFPHYKWMELIKLYQTENPEINIYLLGSKYEYDKSEEIKKLTDGKNVFNLCGKLSLLESAAMIKDAQINYVNDSAPMHLSSAMNAAVTAVYCSTVPSFGFGPLSERSRIVETKLTLNCRPCGLHGYNECPLVHFKCAHSIEISDVFSQ
jgi:lipopolysaccharide heptosyltransferase II